MLLKFDKYSWAPSSLIRWKDLCNLKNTYQLFKQRILIVKTYGCMIIGITLRRIGSLFSRRNLPNQEDKKVRILLEAGMVGWESVFYSELMDSLQDYVGEDCIETSKIDRDQAYLPQVISKLVSVRPTHFCYDPRTGSQNSLRGYYESFVLAMVFGFLKINPIVILTDASIRSWRIQSIILTGDIGVIITFVDVNAMGGLFTHKRVIGPTLMPISEKRLEYLDEYSKTIRTTDSTENNVFFIGSLYPKRSEFFLALNEVLRKIDSKIQVVFENKSEKVTKEGYWNAISGSKSLITTTFQQENSFYRMDRVDLNQMVFRISEALAAGKLLYCGKVPGIEKFFREGIHFVGFSTLEEAARKIDFYSNHVELGQVIASNGRARIGELILENAFWKTIDEMQTMKFIKTECKSV
jgi:hypothetical protein